MYPHPRRFFVRVANKRFTRVVPVRAINDRVKVACFVDVSGGLVRMANKGLAEEGIDLDCCGGTLEDHVAPGHFRVARPTMPSKASSWQMRTICQVINGKSLFYIEIAAPEKLSA
jgi:hypothetical protein